MAENQNEPESKESDIKIIINGQEQTAGKETIKEEYGNKIVELVVESETLNRRIDEVQELQQNFTPEQRKNVNIVEIYVETQDADKATTVLTGDVVKKMDEKECEVSIKANGIDYVIPAKEIGIEQTAEILGVAIENLREIEVQIRIDKVDETIVHQMTEIADENKFEIIVPPVNFTVLAKTKSITGEENEITISKFKQYLQRVMEIPQEVNPRKITTGIVYNEDGTFSHIPTTVFEKDGKWYAKLNSLTNSSYSIIWNEVKVESVENHWSKEYVNDMAARLII